MNNYLINLTLDNLNDTVVTEMEIGDVIEKWIFIPFSTNPVIRGKKGSVIIRMLAVEKRANAFNQSHYLKPKCNKKTYEYLKSIGKDLKILGNMSIAGTAYVPRNSEKEILSSLDEILDKEEE